MGFAAFIYALHGGGNGIWLVLLHDAGHNILDIPWWVWVLGGAALFAVALLAAPELIPFLPGVAAGIADEAAAVAFQQALTAASLEGEALFPVLVANDAADAAWATAYSLALEDLGAAVAPYIAAAGSGAVVFGAGEGVETVLGDAPQVSAAPTAANASSGSGQELNADNPNTWGPSGPNPNDPAAW